MTGTGTGTGTGSGTETETGGVSDDGNRQRGHAQSETGRLYRDQGQKQEQRQRQTQAREQESESDSDSNSGSNLDSEPDSTERLSDGLSGSDTRATGQDDTGGSRAGSDHHAQFTAGVEDSTRGSFGSPDSMTIALTFQAGRRLESPGTAVESARVWADWIGVVGGVRTQQLEAFCNEFSLDPDFINGTGTSPTERLASIGEGSMFHAERTVVVGTPDERSLAVTAGWEFVPITEAASKAAWELRSK